MLQLLLKEVVVVQAERILQPAVAGRCSWQKECPLSRMLLRICLRGKAGDAAGNDGGQQERVEERLASKWSEKYV